MDNFQCFHSMQEMGIEIPMKWAFFVIFRNLYNFQCLSHVFGLQRHKKKPHTAFRRMRFLLFRVCDFLIVALFVVESAKLPAEAIGIGEAVGTDAAGQYLATLLYLHHLYRGLYIFFFHNSYNNN